MNTPIYEPIQGIRATCVDGAENLLRQGEYYLANGQLMIKCPNCRFDNLAPKGVKFHKDNWLTRILFPVRGLTIETPMRCWHCEHAFYSTNGQLYITKEPIHA